MLVGGMLEETKREENPALATVGLYIWQGREEREKKRKHIRRCLGGLKECLLAGLALDVHGLLILY